MKITIILIIFLSTIIVYNKAYAQQNTDSTVVTFAVSPEGSSPRYIYAGTIYGVLRTSNYGESWEHKNEGLTSPTIVMSIVFHPTSGKIFAGTYPFEGVFYSTNNGDNWIQCGNNGLTSRKIWAILIPFDSSHYILAATVDGGIFRSSDEGNSWTAVNQGLMDNVVFTISQIPNGHIFAATESHGVYRSSNYGTSWMQVNNGLTDYCHDFSYSNGYLYALTDVDGVFRSTNNGDSWTQCESGAFYIGYAMTAYSNTVISGNFSFAKVHKSTNNGNTWAQFNQGLPNNSRIRALEVVMTSGVPEYIFTGTWGQGIFRSSNEGNTWVEVNNFISVPVELINFNAVISNGSVILNWSTASETNNRGFEMQRSINGISWNHIGFIEGNINSAETKNYSFTDSQVGSGKYFYRLKQIDFDGSFEYSKEIEIEVTQPTEFALFQNYPNPFNPNTIISWQSPVDGWQTLKIYDALGKEVATLVDEHKSAGSYEINFDATNLSSGVYLYKLHSGIFLSTKKMTVTK